jgi:hypothetical protein
MDGCTYVKGRRVMAENTLSPVAELTDVFDRVIVKTRLAPQERYALSYIHGSRKPQALQATVREMLVSAMEAAGWDEARRIEEYAKYAAHCLRTGERNEFESR